MRSSKALMYLHSVRLFNACYWVQPTVFYPQGTEVERLSRKYKLLSPSHKLGSWDAHHHTADRIISMKYVPLHVSCATCSEPTLCFRRLHLLQARVMRDFRLGVL